MLLDLSAAFDTIDHKILLLHRLENWFGVSGSALRLFSSYLSGRSQSVIINGHCSSPEPLVTGVPQGSVLGPLLFTIYTTPIAHVIQAQSFSYHLYMLMIPRYTYRLQVKILIPTFNLCL